MPEAPLKAIGCLMKKILTITMNPALDVSADTDRVEPVRKLRCGPARREAGGGGVNVARVLKRLDAPVAALFPAGGYIGGLLDHLLAGEGLERLVVPISGETRENFTARETNTGDQYRFVLSGPELSAAECESCLELLAQNFSSVGLLVASGSLPNGAPADFYARMAGMAAKQDIPFMLDTSGPALAGALGPGIDIIKPNLRELSDLVGMELAGEASQISACETLLAEERAGAVALTLGRDGGLLVTGEGIWRARVPDVTVESAVGAGDSFMAGMAWGLAKEWPLEKVFSLGIAAGTAAVLTPGTALCRAEDVWHLASQITLEKL
ncbi:1-phosphofructokinase family hexose kinase [Kordiimonas lipolytica]|uniref:Phosphofructokinase n=2 Tax=Kordiimonas lipolytica TaxID=1662421 RepID=A0ABV8UAR6_9PROT